MCLPVPWRLSEPLVLRVNSRPSPGETVPPSASHKSQCVTVLRRQQKQRIPTEALTTITVRCCFPLSLKRLPWFSLESKAPRRTSLTEKADYHPMAARILSTYVGLQMW